MFQTNQLLEAVCDLSPFPNDSDNAQYKMLNDQVTRLSESTRPNVILKIS